MSAQRKKEKELRLQLGQDALNAADDLLRMSARIELTAKTLYDEACALRAGKASP